MIRNNKYVKNNINAINTILISNRNINFKIHFISSPSYVAVLPHFLLFKRFLIFIKKYSRATVDYIKSKMEEWLQNIEQKTYTKVIEKLWFSLNVHPILSIIFQILLDTKMHYTKNKLHRTLYTSETTFSSADLNLYCCIFSPFS